MRETMVAYNIGLIEFKEIFWILILAHALISPVFIHVRSNKDTVFQTVSHCLQPLLADKAEL